MLMKYRSNCIHTHSRGRKTVCEFVKAWEYGVEWAQRALAHMATGAPGRLLGGKRQRTQTTWANCWRRPWSAATGGWSENRGESWGRKTRQDLMKVEIEAGVGTRDVAPPVGRKTKVQDESTANSLKNSLLILPVIFSSKLGLQPNVSGTGPWSRLHLHTVDGATALTPDLSYENPNARMSSHSNRITVSLKTVSLTNGMGLASSPTSSLPSLQPPPGWKSLVGWNSKQPEVSREVLGWCLQYLCCSCSMEPGSRSEM